MSATIEPKLTAWDERVLRAVPLEDLTVFGSLALDVWDIGKELDVLDLANVDRTLSGLHHLGYVYPVGGQFGHRRRWRRYDKAARA